MNTHEKNSLKKIKNTLRVFAQQHQVPCISSATENYLIQHLMKYKPISCLEIGSAIGYSTLIISSLINSRQGKLTSFEISHPSYRVAVYMLHQANLQNTTIYHNNFISTSLEYIFQKKSLNFVFIDGAKQEYGTYLEKILPYCSPGTTIVCDDVIKFSNKVQSLYTVIKKHQLSYTLKQLESDDGILEIYT